LPTQPSFLDRLQRVEERIATALDRCGRQRSEVTLVAVTKKFPAASIREAYAAGLRHFGENYVQEYAGKHPGVGDLTGGSMHLIGHLQSNKTKLAAELFEVIETVDSPKLAQRLDAAAQSLGKRIEVLIEVRLSDEPNKFGAAPEDLTPIVESLRQATNLDLSGLMTVPRWSENPEDSRPAFQKLAELAAEYKLSKLSMGMSGDLEVAIAEGATSLRIGTALFGPRPKPQ
jgi:pyridoxal phosphate enzyme (YggS family)